MLLVHDLNIPFSSLFGTWRHDIDMLSSDSPYECAFSNSVISHKKKSDAFFKLNTGLKEITIIKISSTNHYLPRIFRLAQT